MVRSSCTILFLIGAAALVVGCSNPVEPSAPPKAEAASPPKPDEDHGHKASSRGGIIVPIGGDKFHAEAVFEKDGLLRLFVLGKDEATVVEVNVQPITAFVKPEGGTESESIVLTAKPQEGDAEGMTSQFVGHLPRAVWGKPVEVSIPTIRIRGERFRLGFKSQSNAEHVDLAMPAKLADEAENKVFLTPGGKYTAADIAANGKAVASVKFKGIRPLHNASPKSGDKLCPISMTKANQKFTWIVGGKAYEFCCLPCVEEFVVLAKEKPGEIQEPEFYRQK